MTIGNNCVVDAHQVNAATHQVQYIRYTLHATSAAFRMQNVLGYLMHTHKTNVNAGTSAPLCVYNHPHSCCELQRFVWHQAYIKAHLECSNLGRNIAVCNFCPI